MEIAELEWVVGVPKVAQITEHLAATIRTGSLTPGARLPSIQALTRRFGVSKFTVVEALERLKAQQLIQSSQGRGFFVTHRHPSPIGVAMGELLPQDFVSVLRRSLIGERAGMRPGCGFLPESWTDGEGIRQALRQVSRQPRLRLAEYGEAAGYLPLRQALQEKLSALGMSLAADQVVTTANTMQGIDMLLRLLLRPGDVVLVDDPCYFNLHGILRLHGARVVPVPRPPEGPDLQALRRVLAEHKPRLYLTAGLLHNPTGHSLVPAQAFGLLQLLAEFGCHLIEDDLYGDLLDGGAPRLASLAGLRGVTYVSGFSKLLTANLRVGYVAASPELAADLAHLKLVCGGVTSEVSERVVLQLMREGCYERNLRRVRHRLQEAGARTDAWLLACGCQLPYAAPAGLFRWVRLPVGCDSEALARAALAHGMVLAPGTLFTREPWGHDFMRLNLAHCDEAPVRERLGALLARVRG
ncbi:GntR family transcriptional regulator [Aeromonas diversa CDC 2478-85]|uniref:GntR family transcriptional regulator n=1 Tax=Aeromonas diversa CDC 2478-85 TaxID=1268237 RepID=N9VMP8_9GAMM|nr:PLP-dependent aminotransferase family protein [Aeromonas diversa]ENY72863.1 GntR family transcriptional regulator [Aeromonas diversa CDC 2478-85]